MAAEPCAPTGNFNWSASSQNPGPCKLPVATGPMVAAAPLWRRLWVRPAKKLKIGCVFSVSQHTVVQALPRLLRLFLLVAVICFSELISAPLALTQPRSFPLPCPSKRVGVQLPQPAPRHAAEVQLPRLRPEERTVLQLA
jgi:hypothetical protein